jgi:hypothetical protein
MFTNNEKKRIALKYIMLHQEEAELTRVDRLLSEKKKLKEKAIYRIMRDFNKMSIIYKLECFTLGFDQDINVQPFEHLIFESDDTSVSLLAGKSYAELEKELNTYNLLRKDQHDCIQKLAVVIKERVAIKSILKGVLKGKEGIFIDGYLLTWKDSLEVQRLDRVLLVPDDFTSMVPGFSPPA